MCTTVYEFPPPLLLTFALFHRPSETTMPLLNPIHGLVVPFLFVVTIPMAIFAGITTTLAFSVLMFRVTLVYLDMVLAFLPQYLMGRSTHPRVVASSYRHSRDQYGSQSQTSVSSVGSAGSNGSPVLAPPQGLVYPMPGYRSPRRRPSGPILLPSGGFGGRRSRRSSQVSAGSLGTVTPRHDAEVSIALGGPSLPPSAAIDRDFEGIGGWRYDDREDDNWIKINSRLELPAERLAVRHHQRSGSGGGAPVTPGEGSWLMMKNARFDTSPERERVATPGAKVSISPNSSRLRINQMHAFTTMDKEEGYFPPFVSPKSTKKSTS